MSALKIFDEYQSNFNTSVNTPRIIKDMPTTRFSFLISHLFANFADTTAANRQDKITMVIGSGDIFAPIEKWLTAPVKATTDIISVLVPTATFKLYPSNKVKTVNIRMPPPLPVKPHIQPMSNPHITASIVLLLLTLTFAISVLSTPPTIGLIKNLNPKNTVVAIEIKPSPSGDA